MQRRTKETPRRSKRLNRAVSAMAWAEQNTAKAELPQVTPRDYEVGAHYEKPTRVRVSRQVKNRKDLEVIPDSLEDFNRLGNVRVRKVARFALTVFDSLPHAGLYLPEEMTEEDLRKDMEEKTPGLFEDIIVSVWHIRQFGSQRMPWVSMEFRDERLIGQIAAVQDIICDGINISSIRSLNRPIRPHLSVAQAFTPERAEEVRALVHELCLPPVEFLPAEIQVDVPTDTEVHSIKADL